MSAKYNFSIERVGKSGLETLQVVNCDSFDEARKIVEKAIYDRELYEKKQAEHEISLGSVTLPPPSPLSTAAPSINPVNIPDMIIKYDQQGNQLP